MLETWQLSSGASLVQNPNRTVSKLKDVVRNVSKAEGPGCGRSQRHASFLRRGGLETARLLEDGVTELV